MQIQVQSSQVLRIPLHPVASCGAPWPPCPRPPNCSPVAGMLPLHPVASCGVPCPPCPNWLPNRLASLPIPCVTLRNPISNTEASKKKRHDASQGSPCYVKLHHEPPMPSYSLQRYFYNNGSMTIGDAASYVYVIDFPFVTSDRSQPSPWCIPQRTARPKLTIKEPRFDGPSQSSS